MIDIAIAARSELGKRSRNEDKLIAGREGAMWLAVLADGAGGHRGAAEAAQLAVEHIDALLHDEQARFDPDTLTRALRSAHAQVQRHQATMEGLDRMHTTVVVLWIDSSRGLALWSHVGDSRLYRIRHGEIALLTADDSVVQRMVDAGLLTAQQADVHPQKNQLIAALGIDDEVEPHTVVDAQMLQEGDAFLLCSDGWWGALDEGDIVTAADDASSPDEWLAAMQRRIDSLAAPHQDNFSAIGVWVGDAEMTRPMQA